MNKTMSLSSMQCLFGLPKSKTAVDLTLQSQTHTPTDSELRIFRIIHHLNLEADISKPNTFCDAFNAAVDYLENYPNQNLPFIQEIKGKLNVLKEQDQLDQILESLSKLSQYRPPIRQKKSLTTNSFSSLKSLHSDQDLLVTALTHTADLLSTTHTLEKHRTQDDAHVVDEATQLDYAQLRELNSILQPLIRAYHDTLLTSQFSPILEKLIRQFKIQIEREQLTNYQNYLSSLSYFNTVVARPDQQTMANHDLWILKRINELVHAKLTIMLKKPTPQIKKAKTERTEEIALLKNLRHFLEEKLLAQYHLPDEDEKPRSGSRFCCFR